MLYIKLYVTYIIYINTLYIDFSEYISETNIYPNRNAIPYIVYYII